jgi:hypothetical protein
VPSLASVPSLTVALSLAKRLLARVGALRRELQRAGLFSTLFELANAVSVDLSGTWVDGDSSYVVERVDRSFRVGPRVLEPRGILLWSCEDMSLQLEEHGLRVRIRQEDGSHQETLATRKGGVGSPNDAVAYLATTVAQQARALGPVADYSEVLELRELLARIRGGDGAALDRLAAHLPRDGAVRLAVTASKSKYEFILRPGEEVIVGRAKEADVQLESSKASRRHLRVAMTSSESSQESFSRSTIVAEDKSVSGSYLNGVKFHNQTVTLKDGDSIEVRVTDGAVEPESVSLCIAVPQAGSASSFTSAELQAENASGALLHYVSEPTDPAARSARWSKLRAVIDSRPELLSELHRLFSIGEELPVRTVSSQRVGASLATLPIEVTFECANARPCGGVCSLHAQPLARMCDLGAAMLPRLLPPSHWWTLAWSLIGATVLQRARPAVWEDDKWKEAVVVDVALHSPVGVPVMVLDLAGEGQLTVVALTREVRVLKPSAKPMPAAEQALRAWTVSVAQLPTEQRPAVYKRLFDLTNTPDDTSSLPAEAAEALIALGYIRNEDGWEPTRIDGDLMQFFQALLRRLMPVNGAGSEPRNAKATWVVQVSVDTIPEDVFMFWWESLQEAMVPSLLELGVPDDGMLQEGLDVVRDRMSSAMDTVTVDIIAGLTHEQAAKMQRSLQQVAQCSLSEGASEAAAFQVRPAQPQNKLQIEIGSAVVVDLGPSTGPGRASGEAHLLRQFTDLSGSSQHCTARFKKIVQESKY